MNFPQNRLFLLAFLFVFCYSNCQTQPVMDDPDIFIEDTGFKVVGYLSEGNFSQIDQVGLDKITHLCLAFANPDADGNLLFGHGSDVGPVVVKAHNAEVKVLVSLAGGGEPGRDIWKRMLSPSNRTAFISQIVAYVLENNLDGVDVDIEWNLLPAIDTLYASFVIELKNALHAHGKMMTSALNVSGLHPAVTQESLAAFDFISIMVYDKTGPWKPENPGQHSPFSYAEEAYIYWTQERKIPSDKLVLGMPFYGHNFDPVGSEDYANIVKADIANAYKDQVGELYYNGIPEIVRKTELAKAKFNGVMFWELSQDAHNELSLLRAVDQTLKAVDCQVSMFFKDEDGDGFGNLARPFQACQVPDGYVTDSKDTDDNDPEVHP